jgi:ParB/RepB/Spo0J family partition protein
MAITEEQQAGVEMIALERIRTDQNVREGLAVEEVDALARSIELLGQLTPVSVRPDTDSGGYVLIAGHKRHAALTKLGRDRIRAEVRTDDGSEACERAAENVVRSQLNAHEEAIALRAMLERGLSEDGAAQALGWPKARVTARVRLLELPEAARQMIGRGAIALSAVEPLRAVGRVSPELLELVVAYAAENDWAAQRLGRETGRVVSEALGASEHTLFAAWLDKVAREEPKALRLGKKTEAAYEQAGELARQLDRYSYGPTVRFAEAEVDQARAAGALLELEGTWPIVMDKSLYRELCKQAIARTVSELEAQIAERAQERKLERQQRAAGRVQDPQAEARRGEQRQLRELARQAHGVNLDLGAGLMTGLSTVDPSDMAVARFFVLALLGSDHDGSAYTETGERVLGLAMSGIRLVIDEFRADATMTKKDGTKGALRIEYQDPKDPAGPLKWLWRYIDGAKTAGELYGRALVVIAAERYACRLVVPQAQRGGRERWSSHNDRAAKALQGLVKPHLPASLARLEKAIERAHRDALRVERQAGCSVDERGFEDGDGADVDVDEEQVDGEQGEEE